MTETQPNRYNPTTVSPPGATLADMLEERAIPQAELAMRMDVTPKFVNELVAGKVSLTPNTALALERALDVPADFWLARDARYQEARARIESKNELEAAVGWLDELPLRDMLSFEWIREQSNKADYVGEGLRFFGVATVEAWREKYIRQTVEAAAYRASEKVPAQVGAVAAWLRAGELEAARITCKPFDRHVFLQSLEESRQFTLVTDPSTFIPKLTDLFASCGMAIVFVRAPRGCPVSGAVRWLSPVKALVQLSLRYKTNDHLWFTFFHECGHIALHGKKMLFLEDGKIANAEETEANKFAADRLIPAALWSGFNPESVTAATIRTFAKEVGIAPSIVLGRLQKEGRVPWNRLNGLKVRYLWQDPD
jgi:HTH-type transcriptional regulator / antitoxin HigA